MHYRKHNNSPSDSTPMKIYFPHPPTVFYTKRPISVMFSIFIWVCHSFSFAFPDKSFVRISHFSNACYMPLPSFLPK